MLQYEVGMEATMGPRLCCLPTAAAAPSISSVPSDSDRLEPSTGDRPFSIFTSSRKAGEEPSTRTESEGGSGQDEQEDGNF